MDRVTIDSLDSAGNLTRRERTTFDYDDGGFRISALHEIDSTGDGTFETRTLTEFLADKNNHTGYEQTIEETVTDADTGAEIKKTIYTIGLDAIAQTVFEPGGPTEGETHVFLYDGHGSVRMLTDMLAAVIESYNFDAWGNAVGFDPAAALTSLLYSGEHNNASIAQQYLRARWYDPATGRFNRLDPFAGNFSDPQSLHKYLYANADPVNGVDPSGLFTIAGFLSGFSIQYGLRRVKNAYDLGLGTWLRRTVIALALSALIQFYAFQYLPPLERELRGLAGDLAKLPPLPPVLAAILGVQAAADKTRDAYEAITWGNIKRVGLAVALAPFPKLKLALTLYVVGTALLNIALLFGTIESAFKSTSDAATAVGFPLCIEMNYGDIGGLLHTGLKFLRLQLDPAGRVAQFRSVVRHVQRGNNAAAQQELNRLIQNLHNDFGGLIRIKRQPC